MSDTPEKFWESVAPHLQRHLGLHEPSLEEAQAAFDTADDEPLSVEQLRSIAAFAKGKGPLPEPERKPTWLQNLTSVVRGPELIPAFNRNAGDDDVSVSQLMDELRKKALSECNDEAEEDMDSAPDPEDE